MNRKTFFTTLSALLVTVAAKAQSTIITPCRPRIRWGEQIPLCNGQCPNPECDYRADPFPTDTLMALDAYSVPQAPETFYQSWYQVGPRPTPIGENPYVRTGPRLNRCPKCNTAFWQDPEKPQ